jgi:hypothetical protein
MTRDQCWSTLLQQCFPAMTSGHGGCLVPRRNATLLKQCERRSFLNTLLQQCESGLWLARTVPTMTSDHITAMTLDIIVAFYTTVAFAIALSALLTSTPVIRCEERLWNFSTPFQILFICGLFSDAVSS